MQISEHYDTIAAQSNFTDRQESLAIGLRNANNAVKALQIEASVRRAVLLLPESRRFIVVHDLACGKGGDLAKYGRLAQQLGIQILYYGVDVSDESIKELQKRWQNTFSQRYSKYMTVTAITGNMCTRSSPAFYSQWPVADIVSIQFAIHYAWKSIADARALANNIGRCLANHCGQVICNIVDSQKLLSNLASLAHVVDQNTVEFSNSICNIKIEPQQLYKWHKHCQIGKKNESLFGIEYRFSLANCLDDCAEWVVNESSVVQIFKTLGLDCCEAIEFGKIETEESRQLDADQRQVYNLYKTMTFARGLL